MSKKRWPAAGVSGETGFVGAKLAALVPVRLMWSEMATRRAAGGGRCGCLQRRW